MFITHLVFRDKTVVFRKDGDEHLFRKFTGYGLNKDDAFEIIRRGAKKIILIVCKNGTETPYYTTPFEWLAKGKYYDNDGEEQVIMPIEEMKNDKGTTS